MAKVEKRRLKLFRTCFRVAILILQS